MDKALEAAVSDIRLKSGNPYALIEYLEADEVAASTPFERLVERSNKTFKNNHCLS